MSAASPHPRRGVVLILVVGMAMLILAVTFSMVTVVRADIRSTQPLIRDTQARAMLDAALCYIAEGSRIGWAPFDARNPPAIEPTTWWTETLGWNDVRNGRIGPIPLRVQQGGTLREDPQEDATLAQLVRGPLVQTQPVWPAVGSVVRIAMAPQTRPPFAVQLGMGNPITWHPDAASVPTEGGWYRNLGSLTGAHGQAYGANYSGALSWLNGANTNLEAQGLQSRDLGTNSHHGNPGTLNHFPILQHPDPAPLDLGRPTFNSGDPQPLVQGERLSWFRVHREHPRDHNGDRTPWYDTIDLNGGEHHDSEFANASIFVITCGAGPTLGYRNWAEAVSTLGLVNAQRLFNSEAAFNDLRSTEVILWFRAEWTPLTGGNMAPEGALTASAPSGATRPNRRNPNYLRFFWRTGGNNTRVYRQPEDGGQVLDQPMERTLRAPYPAPFGSFLWIQALDREPPLW